MLSTIRIAALTLTLTTGLVAAGCGANASLSPTGPSMGASSSSALTADVIAGADEASALAGKGGHGKVDAGQGQPGDKDKDKDKDKGKDSDKGKGVDVNGRITAIDAAARTLTVGTTQVSVPVAAIIRHGSTSLTFAALAAGDHVQVKGTLNATAVLVAFEVKVEQGGKGPDDDDDVDDDEDDDADDDDADEAELTGTVSAAGGICPAATFTVGTTKVATTATTTFRKTTCAAIVNGTIVEVKGTPQADGSIVATRVSLED